MYVLLDVQDGDDKREVMILVAQDEVTESSAGYNHINIQTDAGTFDGIIMSGNLILKDIVSQARILDQRAIFTRLICELLQAKTVLDEVSEEQFEALRNLESVYSKGNPFRVVGERHIIFRAIVIESETVDSVEDLRDKKLNKIRWQLDKDGESLYGQDEIKLYFMMGEIVGF